ncbi:MAG TPA: D-glycero-beta-D-manno-heptose 1,7-bisphosphate 7-phosphatase [Candidatus Andersenbacteria bacterium]|nr:D-glycero-beta-D-manno-heptose 1,7-bisphosphate 7-phosphatase [Candidatus Andersenbacteria bacterium]
MLKRVIFLDRDGTLNVDHGYVHSREQWEWVPGALDACKQLQDAGYTLAVITNQSGIAHGLYTEEAMHELHRYMRLELDQYGVHLAMIAFCPHARSQTDCDCRKPHIGMAKQIEAKIGEIDYANSWTVGDKEADLLFGKTAGTKTALIRSKYWEEGKLTVQPDMVVDSLEQAAVSITSSQLGRGRSV